MFFMALLEGILTEPSKGGDEGRWDIHESSHVRDLSPYG